MLAGKQGFKTSNPKLPILLDLLMNNLKALSDLYMLARVDGRLHGLCRTDGRLTSISRHTLQGETARHDELTLGVLVELRQVVGRSLQRRLDHLHLRRELHTQRSKLPSYIDFTICQAHLY